jgi:hypothetical protein
MKRKGSNIDQKLCSKACTQLDPEKEYDSWELIEHYRHQRKVRLEDLLGWLMGEADWVGDKEQEDYVTAKLNEFIQENEAVGEEPNITHIESCTNPDDKHKMFMAYDRGVSYKQQEKYKQALYDKFFDN